ncbi:MAG: nicotinate-nucleotide--dimethylbenzimidazole phosphoribosyltransferase [Ruminococcaceae bacterium]|nr:nicotinate-nucleotide--dimethylbenzimidazole phosphoribosyltransferase [Oscillospiraceae bacterium]
MKLCKLIEQITPADEAARAAAQAHWDACAKPLGSLGLLETAVCDIAALTGGAEIALSPRTVLVLCADNGVVAQGVTQTGSGVTAAVARQLALGRTSVCRMAEVAHCRVVPVDMGIKDFPGCDGVLDRRVGNGTTDFTEGGAMTREQAEAAILTGVELVRGEVERGTRLLATGEMGIGNTTTSSAIASVLLGVEPEQVTGRGAGLSDDGLARKTAAIRRGVEVNKPNRLDALDVLAKLGGFDLAGMCGVFLGGALYRVPVLIDGFPSAVAALCAARLCPNARKAMLASHVSAEPAGAMVLRALDKKPPITAEMRLGEGTGAVAAMPLLDMALAVYREGYTFTEGGIEPYTPQ